MSFQNILHDREDGIVWITLNRPEALNALNRGLWRELHRALDMAEKDNNTRVVIVTGAGRAFSAGDDIKEVASLKTPAAVEDFILNFAAPAIMKIVEMSKPVIAAVNGPAYGGGCEIAMLSDLVIASENASFAVPEARIGAYPPIASAIGFYLVGKLNISMMTLTGEPITAKEAERIGLVNKVVPPEQLKSAARELAEKIMLSAPTSIGVVKKTLNKRFKRRDLEHSVMQLVALLKSEEAREGHQAFIEKRPPEWTKRK
jgi:enoyl-CoA hydratase/3-hydroxyacyl-CoA dehydrogenase